MKTRIWLLMAVAAAWVAPSAWGLEIHRYNWITTSGPGGFSGELVLSQDAFDARAFDIDTLSPTVLEFRLGTPKGAYNLSQGRDEVELAGRRESSAARLLKLEGILDENGALSKLLFILAIPSLPEVSDAPVRFVAREGLVEEFTYDSGTTLTRGFVGGQWNPLPSPQPTVPDATSTLPLLLLSVVLLFVPGALSRRLRHHAKP